jgi:hypothetical protein
MIIESLPETSCSLRDIISDGQIPKNLVILRDLIFLFE